MKHVEVVCAVIENDKKEIFCCKRGPNRALEDYWEFPGGKIDKTDKTKEDTIIREIKEELNSVIEPVKYLGKTYYEYHHVEPFDPFSITMYAYKCNLISGSLELTEHKEAKWVKPKDLSNLDFAKADIPIIQMLEGAE